MRDDRTITKCEDITLERLELQKQH